MYVCMYEHLKNLAFDVKGERDANLSCVSIYVCMYTYLHTRIYTIMFKYTYKNVYICIYMCVTYVYIYMYKYTLILNSSNLSHLV